MHVVRSDSYAGVERYISDTATELRRRGWLVTVVGGDAVRMRSELPPDVMHMPASTVLGVARQLLRVGDIDILHAHMTAAEVPAAILKRRARLVVTRHFATPRGSSALGRLARPIIARRLDTQIAISQFVADEIHEAATMIHNGVAPGSHESLTRARTVVVLQRLEPEKDTATAIRAWARSDLAATGWRLVIHGRGTELAALRALTDAVGVGDSVEFAGFTDSPRDVLAGAGIVLATAPAEPFGLTVVEAMAEAAPVVAARGGAHGETLGDHGLFFGPGDDVACAALLVDLATDADRRHRLGQLLAQRQADLFTVIAHVDRLEQEYRR